MAEDKMTTSPTLEKTTPVDLTKNSSNEATAEVNAMLVKERDEANAVLASVQKELARTRLELKAFTKRTQSLTNEVLNNEFRIAQLEEELEMRNNLASFQGAIIPQDQETSSQT